MQARTSKELTPKDLGGLSLDQYMRRSQIIYSHVHDINKGLSLIKQEKVMRNDESEQDLIYIFEMLATDTDAYNKYAPMFLNYQPKKPDTNTAKTFCGLKMGFLNKPNQSNEAKLPPGNFYRKTLHELSAEELNTSCCILEYTPKDTTLKNTTPSGYVGIIFPSCDPSFVGVMHVRELLEGKLALWKNKPFEYGIAHQTNIDQLKGVLLEKGFTLQSFAEQKSLCNHEMHIFKYYEPTEDFVGDNKTVLDLANKSWEHIAKIIKQTPDEIEVNGYIIKINGPGTKKLNEIRYNFHLWKEGVRNHLPIVNDCFNLTMQYIDNPEEQAFLQQFSGKHQVVVNLK